MDQFRDEFGEMNRIGVSADLLVSSGPGLHWAVMGPTGLFRLGWDDGGRRRGGRRVLRALRRQLQPLVGRPRTTPPRPRNGTAARRGPLAVPGSDDIYGLAAHRDALLTTVVAATHGGSTTPDAAPRD